MTKYLIFNNDPSTGKRNNPGTPEAVACEIARAVDKDAKGLYDYVVCDSETEKIFAAALDADDRAKLIVKLPDNYKIETPVGGYNPDWAIVLEDGDVVYMVRETKGGRDLSKLQFPTERMKILYGVKHFDAIGADYDWLEKASEVEPRSRIKRGA